MKIDGVKWTPLKGHFIPLESAIAQMLLRLKVEDFDSRVGPCYKEFPTSGGNVESIRVYNAFNSSKYAIDMQKWVNVLCLESFCKPLVLYLAILYPKITRSLPSLAGKRQMENGISVIVANFLGILSLIVYVYM